MTAPAYRSRACSPRLTPALFHHAPAVETAPGAFSACVRDSACFGRRGMVKISLL
ncbi:hypothetical protein HMPREF3039_02703 [Akkermansia sp. KLE1798]|nr:hypothetical protein HMPREF3039_02703 [Akkermansia sp. KLE1798]